MSTESTQEIYAKSSTIEIDEHQDDRQSTNSGSNLNRSMDGLCAHNLNEQLEITSQTHFRRKLSAPNTENLKLDINAFTKLARPGNGLRNSYLCKLISKGLLC